MTARTAASLAHRTFPLAMASWHSFSGLLHLYLLARAEVIGKVGLVLGFCAVTLLLHFSKRKMLFRSLPGRP